MLPQRDVDKPFCWETERDRGERDYIGFATLPEQVHRKSVKRGFDFTLMVVGESGLGKSTLINSLFLGDLYRNRMIPDVHGNFLNIYFHSNLIKTNVTAPSKSKEQRYI